MNTKKKGKKGQGSLGQINKKVALEYPKRNLHGQDSKRFVLMKGGYIVGENGAAFIRRREEWWGSDLLEVERRIVREWDRRQLIGGREKKDQPKCARVRDLRAITKKSPATLIGYTILKHNIILELGGVVRLGVSIGNYLCPKGGKKNFGRSLMSSIADREYRTKGAAIWGGGCWVRRKIEGGKGSELRWFDVSR